MPVQYLPEEDPVWSYDKMMSSPGFDDHETITGPMTDDWMQYSWKLDASYAGQRIYALPDAGILSYSPAMSFPGDMKFIENYASVSVVQPYIWYNHDGSVFQRGFQVFSYDGEPDPRDEYDLPYSYMDVPDLYEDWHSESPLDNSWVDYADHYILLAGTKSAGMEQHIGVDADARILVTTFGPDSRDGAWGPDWLNHYYVDGSSPESEDNPVASHYKTYLEMLKAIFEAPGTVAKVEQAREIASEYLDLGNLIKMDTQTLGAPAFAPLGETNPKFSDYFVEHKETRPAKTSDVLDKAGKVLDALEAGLKTYQTYQESGDISKALQAGSVKLLAAVIGGEIGTFTGGVAAGFLVTTLGAPVAATGLATLAGIGIGFYVGNKLSDGIEVGANWALNKLRDDGAPQLQMAAAASAAPQPTWSYNLETGKFKWLDSKAGAKFGQFTTLLDLNPKPVGLKLTGDHYLDKDDFLLGHGGRDTMISGNGNDILYGADGADSMSGGKGKDILYGDRSNDTIKGADSSDTIFGGAGDDRIFAGKGADHLTGESGRDHFIFTTLAEIGKGTSGDKIYDFRRGTDKIDLSAIDGNPGKRGHQDLKFSQFKQTYIEGDGWLGQLRIEADLNRDGDADFTLKLLGVRSLGASDFIL
jgi:hypothetical protein